MKQANHLKFAHACWEEQVNPGDIVIDATCGNGYDTLFLANIALTNVSGTLFSLDIQPEAIESAKGLLLKELNPLLIDKVNFVLGSHAAFPNIIAPESVQLIVYNLGYLPGGDKTKTTMTDSTLQSISQAQLLIKKRGMISITCYPGHEEGKHEEEAILNYCAQLNPREWTCCHHQWINRKSAPSLLILTRSIFL
jgi:tRNA G37 N-methylase Trm5